MNTTAFLMNVRCDLAHAKMRHNEMEKRIIIAFRIQTKGVKLETVAVATIMENSLQVGCSTVLGHKKNPPVILKGLWAQLGSNQRPKDYESSTLTN